MGNTKNSNIPFFIIMGLATVLFLYLLKPFFFPIFWAAVVAGIFRPLYRRINDRLNRPRLNRALLVEKAAEVVRGITNYIFVHLKELTQNTIGLIVKMAIMLYTLFFFIRDGEKFLRMAMRLSNLGMGREGFLYERFIVTARP